MKLLPLLASLFLYAQSYAQDSCACCNSTSQEFNFWIGDWIVYDTLGNVIGENYVEVVAQTCVLRENWTSVQGGQGVSMNYYDKSDSLWHQLWVDGNGGVLNLIGELIDDSMVLDSKPFVNQKNITVKNRIIWTPLNDGSVEQRWVVLDEKDNVLNVLFVGIYKLRE